MWEIAANGWLVSDVADLELQNSPPYKGNRKQKTFNLLVSCNSRNPLLAFVLYYFI